MFSYTFSKADCFQNKANIYDLLSHRQKAHLIPQRGDCLKIFNHPHNNALWRHILTGYDFYSSVNWNNLVTTFMQKFQNLLHPVMLDITVFYLVDYNMQYGLSAKKYARKKNSVFACLSNNATPTTQHSHFLFHARQIIQYFCAYLHAGGWFFKTERNHLRCIYRSMRFRGIIKQPSYNFTSSVNYMKTIVML